jgi:hypothetical protein
MLLRNHFNIFKTKDLYTFANFPKRSPSLKQKFNSNYICGAGRHPRLRGVNVKRENNQEPLAGSWLNVSNVSPLNPKPSLWRTPVSLPSFPPSQESRKASDSYCFSGIRLSSLLQ